MNVFVLDTNKKPQNPVNPAKARLLLSEKNAVFRQYPFTIILKKGCVELKPKPLRVKIDPGSKTTGIAVIDDNTEGNCLCYGAYASRTTDQK